LNLESQDVNLTRSKGGIGAWIMPGDSPFQNQELRMCCNDEEFWQNIPQQYLLTANKRYILRIRYDEATQILAATFYPADQSEDNGYSVTINDCIQSPLTSSMLGIGINVGGYDNRTFYVYNIHGIVDGD